ncbi:ArsC family reductase [Sphingomonas qilianensis]|uniref:ArsC family reductase n=1 Tax=Sphingomonas qilianensis TaxID=1736690 RepID=A0ABU9XV96_9SPHN
MKTRMFGIPNCDTVKKARSWLETHGVAYAFHDYKKVGIDEATLRRWSAQLGWEALLNRKGTTFRKLPEAERAHLNEDNAIALMLASPSMIKRPVIEQGTVLLAGFAPDTYLKQITG